MCVFLLQWVNHVLSTKWRVQAFQSHASQNPVMTKVANTSQIHTLQKSVLGNFTKQVFIIDTLKVYKKKKEKKDSIQITV